MRKMGKVKPIMQNRSKQPQTSLSSMRIVFLCCGFSTLILGSIGISYMIYAIKPTNVWGSALQPLIFFFVALLLGLLDLVLWSSTSKLTPSVLQNGLGEFPPELEETSSGDKTVPQGPSWQPPYYPESDPEATVPIHPPSPSTVITRIGLPITNTKPITYSPTEVILKFQYYILPREGSNLERCADKLFFDHKRARYAVADGVGTSFLPGYWAQTVTREFVEHDTVFEHVDDIIKWQGKCSELWHGWVENEWIPQAFAASGQEDWSREIERGAATTFVGCSFLPTPLAQNGSTKVSVNVVGDAEFFLLKPIGGLPGHWVCKEFFRLQQFQDFGQTTETLATPERRFLRDYKWMHSQEFTAHHGDCIVLTTDALAQWILLQMENDRDPWRELFSLLSQEEFKNFVYRCRAAGEIEVDDTTMMIIPLNS